jgi:hypothetical protein
MLEKEGPALEKGMAGRNRAARKTRRRRTRHMAEAESERYKVGQVVGVALMSPPRTVLALVIGSAVLAARAVGQAIEEGERQLSRLGSALGRTPEAAESRSDADPASAAGQASEASSG